MPQVRLIVEYQKVCWIDVGRLFVVGGRNAVIAYGMATVFMPMCQNVFPRIVLRGPMLGILLYKWNDIYMLGGRQNLYFKCKRIGAICSEIGIIAKKYTKLK